MKDLNKDEHYITVPRKQFEEMEAYVKELKSIVDSKKDIVIVFQLEYTEMFLDDELMFQCSCAYDGGKPFDYIRAIEIQEMIRLSCIKAIEAKQKEVVLFHNKLKAIESKWWYKLFYL